MTFKRPWRWLGLGLLLLATAVGVAQRQPWREARQPAAAPVLPSTAASAATWWTAAGVSAARGAGTPAAGAIVAGPSPGDANARGESIEVCGAGLVNRQEVENWQPAVDGAPPPAWQRAQDLRKDAALRALAARLATGSDSEQVVARLLMRDTEGAAIIAARSRDATAYRLALGSCDGWAGRDAPHCRALSVKGWAQLACGALQAGSWRVRPRANCRWR